MSTGNSEHFFSYEPDGYGILFHNTEEDAAAQCERSRIESASEIADGWSETGNEGDLCYGVVLGRVGVFKRQEMASDTDDDAEESADVIELVMEEDRPLLLSQRDELLAALQETIYLIETQFGPVLASVNFKRYEELLKRCSPVIAKCEPAASGEVGK